ncbi:hypothetical protein, partial [Acrocarpospora corrugata]|uniref:hypothetical protein n=1 Tax=Acrocarpospora corrugata TaxID=35763 RepID=UPI001C3FC60A
MEGREFGLSRALARAAMVVLSSPSTMTSRLAVGPGVPTTVIAIRICGSKGWGAGSRYRIGLG